MYLKFIKPIFDFLLGLILILLFSPVFFVLAALLTISNNGSPFFTQVRTGKDGNPFSIIKFKTMNDDCDEQGNLLPDAQRLTSVGRIVRKSSLDELPQLLNVIKGEMSLVGPRPLLMSYLPLYNAFQIRRHEVKPGITGWAQVNGRNSISWEKKFQYDVEYVDNISMWMDLKILFLTFLKVVKRADINAGESVGMEPFKGT